MLVLLVIVPLVGYFLFWWTIVRFYKTYPHLVGGISFDMTPVRMQIGAYEYDIPRNYQDTTTSPNCRYSGALLWAVLPGLEGRNANNAEEFHSANKDSRWVTILIGVFPKLPVLMEHLKHQMALAPQPRNYPSVWYERKQGPYGLVFFEPQNVQSFDYDYTKELYVDESENPTVLIVCDMPSTIRNPGCTQYMVYRDAQVEISYGRKYLPTWEAVNTGLRHLLDQWFVGIAPAERSDCPGQYFERRK